MNMRKQTQYTITPMEIDTPVTVTDSTLDELATLLECGELEVSMLDTDLVDSVIDYQFR